MDENDRGQGASADPDGLKLLEETSELVEEIARSSGVGADEVRKVLGTIGLGKALADAAKVSGVESLRKLGLRDMVPGVRVGRTAVHS